MDDEARHFYEFGPFRIDPTKRLLLRDGEPQPLTPKAFDILLVLVRHGGQVVEKDELMRAVWPDTVVEENNLTRNISALRKALREGPHEHRYVVTVPGRGYSFVAGAKDLAEEPADLLVAKYSKAHIVIEEQETDEQDQEKQAFQPKILPKISRGRPTAARWKPRPALFMTGALLVAMLVLALSYFWISRRSRLAEGTGPRVTSIAVLPFQTLSAGGDGDEYLGLGMADALITRLGSVRQVVVRPTSAVRKYADPGQDPVAAGREQGVEAVLDGSLQRAGNRIRVTVRLVNVRDGASLWAGRFDEKLTDIFAVQDRVSEQVAQAMLPELTGKEQKLLTKSYTENAEAYRAYLKGRYFWNKRTEEGYLKAIEHFGQAVELDPRYAQAHAGLADSYALSGTAALPRREAMAKAKAAALRALEADDTLAEAHTALAFVKMHYDWDWPGAEKGFKRAIELGPNYATAHHWYAYGLMALGRMDEAVAEIRRAQEIDPLSLIINTDLGEILYYARRYDEALEQSRKTLEMDSNFVLARRVAAWSYLKKGMYREAIAELRQAVHISGGGADESAWLAYAHAVAGERSKALGALDKLRELSEQGRVAPISLAIVYVGLGEKDQAFAWLERVFEERDGVLVLLKVWPLLDPLRSDARYASLLKRVGLP